MLLAASPALAGSPAQTSAPGIVTVAGGVGGPGPARTVPVDACGVTVAGGSLYVGNSLDVRRVSTSTGMLTTVAGNGAEAGGGSGAGAAQFAFGGQVCGTAVDKAGNLLVTDNSNVDVLAARTGEFYGQSMTAGDVYVVDGNGGNATLQQPVGVAVDRAGNIVVTDQGMPDCGGEDCPPQGARILVIAGSTGTFYGAAMTAGGLYAIAGILTGPAPEGNTGLAARAWIGPTIGAVRLDGAGNLVLPDDGELDLAAEIAPSVRIVAARTGTFYGQKMTAGHIYRVAGDGLIGDDGDGGPATRASLSQATGVAVDRAGNLVLTEGGLVRVVAVRTGRYYGHRMTAGHIYDIAGAGPAGVSGDGGPSAKARIDANAVAVDGAGNVVLGCGFRVRVAAFRSGTFYGRRMVAGRIYTVAGTGSQESGNGGPALKAELHGITGTAEDPSGDVAFADTDGRVWVVMARPGRVYGRTLAAGDGYIIGGNGALGYSGDGGPAVKAAFSADEVAFDRAGNVVVADSDNERVRVIAVRTGTFYGRKMAAGFVYTVAGNGACAATLGDGGPATNAPLCGAASASPDHAGNLLVVDGNQRVRVVAVSTGTFYGRKMTAGHIYTIAGDGHVDFNGDGIPATKAGMSPEDAVADLAGNVIVTIGGDGGRVRVVAASNGTFYGQKMTAGDIYTIAGHGTFGISGSGGPATAAELEDPYSAAVDGAGNVVIADRSAGVVWVVAVKSGMYYGMQMTAGDIYIVAGDNTDLGSDGLGDGRPALGAVFDLPAAVAVSPGGGLLVGDGYDFRVRAMSF